MVKARNKTIYLLAVSTLICGLLIGFPSFADYQTNSTIYAKEGSTAVIYGDMYSDVWALMYNLPNFGVCNIPRDRMAAFLDNYFDHQFNNDLHIIKSQFGLAADEYKRIDLHANKTTGRSTMTLDGVTETELWGTVYGRSNVSDISPLRPISSGNRVLSKLSYYVDTNNTYIDDNDVEDITWDYAIVLEGINANANNYSTAVVHDYNDAGADLIADEYEYSIISGKTFPDSYEDMVYPSERDLNALCPWYKQYPTSITTGYWGTEWNIGSMESSTAASLYTTYKDSGLMEKATANALWKTLLGSEKEFLKDDLNSSYYLSDPQYYDWWLTGTLSDYVSTKIPTEAVQITVKESEHDTGYSYSYYDVYTEFTTTSDLVSTWQVSAADGSDSTWYTIASGVVSEARAFEFNIIDHCFRIAGVVYEMPAAIASANSWNIRRVSTSAQYGGTVTSPSMRIRSGLTFDGIDAVALKDVVEMGYIQPEDVRLTVHYSTGDVVMSGKGSYIEYFGTQIFAVGRNANIVYYTFHDPQTGGEKKGSFYVTGVKKTPISITARYDGGNVIEGMEYKPSQLIVNVTYNNGTVSTFRAENNSSIGTYKTQSYGKGDVDGNGVLNSADLTAFDEARTTANLTSAKFAQADWNSDGVINDADRQGLAEVISRTYKSGLGEKTFYATYSGLNKSNGTPVYASFKVRFVQKSPYSIYVTQKPTKTKYIEGENFDPTGMILVIYYNNGDLKEINFDGMEDTDGLTIGTKDYPAEKMKADQTKVEIKYSEGDETVKTELPINIVEATLTSIKVERAPDTTLYYSGENFHTTGMDVYAYFDETVEGHKNDRKLLSTNEYYVSGGKQMMDSTDYVVIKESTITDANRATEGYVRIKRNRLVNGDDIDLGDTGTFEYTTGVKIAGECVGNQIIGLSYTYNGVTKKTYVPIIVLGRKLSNLSVLSMPYTTEYMAGQSFDSTGLIIKANFTDGTLEYLYPKSASKNGYEIINGDHLAVGAGYVVAQYSESEITLETEIPITVIDPDISSITANYVGTPVYVNNSFDPHDVQIIVSYTNGETYSFRGDDSNPDGSRRVKLIPFETEDLTADEDLKIYSEGRQKFAALYSGLVAEFSVEGIGNPSQENYTSAVAKSRVKYSYWTETFTATKIQSVSDFISGKVEAELTGDSIEASKNLAQANPRSNTDTRTYLTADEGTGNYDPSNLSNPSQTFTRQGEWRMPESVVSIEYRGRTSGYLFPDSSTPALANATGEETPYIDAYNQDRTAVRNASTVGWGDWMQNGDSAGTVNAGRTAYNYTGTGTDATTITMALDRLEIRLKNVEGSDDPKLLITYVDTAGTSHGPMEATTTEVQLLNPQKIKILLDGNVTVTNNDGTTSQKPFGEVYKIYYRASTNDVQQWSKGGVADHGTVVTDGEFAGYDGTPIQNIEIRLLLKESDFQTGGSSNAPVISEQPKNAQVRIGYQAIFAVTAIGNALNYQWYRNGSPIGGATSSVYTLNNAQKTDSGSVFYCVVSDSEGYQSSSSHVNLTVTDVSPVLTEDLTDLTCEADTTVVLRVTATCYDPGALTYYWEMSAGNNTWQPMSNNGSATISFVADSTMHGKKIRCKVSNSAGSIYSNTCKISCLARPTLNLYTTKDHLVVSNSEFATITADAATGAPGGLKYLWTVDGVERGGDTNAVIKYLPSTAGTHIIKCTVSDIYNNETISSLYIYVGYLPKITLTTTQTVTGGKVNVTVTAAVTGTASTYTWSYDNQPVTASTPNVTVSADKKSLTITGLSAGAQHTVQLDVANSYGTATAYHGISTK